VAAFLSSLVPLKVLQAGLVLIVGVVVQSDVVAGHIKIMLARDLTIAGLEADNKATVPTPADSVHHPVPVVEVLQVVVADGVTELLAVLL